jgi:hypothetical protein
MSSDDYNSTAFKIGVIQMSIQSEAVELVQRHKGNIEYLQKFGSPIEKAMVKVVLAASQGDNK